MLDGTWGRWAVEVKTGPFTERDLAGLLEFTRRHPAYRPLVLASERGAEAALRAGAASLPWKRFLLGELPRRQD